MAALVAATVSVARRRGTIDAVARTTHYPIDNKARHFRFTGGRSVHTLSKISAVMPIDSPGANDTRRESDPRRARNLDLARLCHARETTRQLLDHAFLESAELVVVLGWLQAMVELIDKGLARRNIELALPVGATDAL